MKNACPSQRFWIQEHATDLHKGTCIQKNSFSFHLRTINQAQEYRNNSFDIFIREQWVKCIKYHKEYAYLCWSNFPDSRLQQPSLVHGNTKLYKSLSRLESTIHNWVCEKWQLCMQSYYEAWKGKALRSDCSTISLVRGWGICCKSQSSHLPGNPKSLQRSKWGGKGVSNDWCIMVINLYYYQRTEHRLRAVSWLSNFCFGILTDLTQIINSRLLNLLIKQTGVQ